MSRMSLAADFIRSYVEHAGADGVVLGVSGGIDSAVCFALCIEALRPGKRVVGLWMPCGIADTGYIDILKHHFLPTMIFDTQISSIVSDAKAVPLQLRQGMDEARGGNLMARVRMMLLYDYAKANNLLVVGTSNRTEIMVGYFTKWGDGAGDIAPIANLYKHEVIEVAKDLRIPDEIIRRVPSADFWEGQTDEGELGISYDDLDAILEGLEKIHRARSALEIYTTQRQLESEFSVDMIDHVLGMMQSTAHKRCTIPNPDNWCGWER